MAAQSIYSARQNLGRMDGRIGECAQQIHDANFYPFTDRAGRGPTHIFNGCSVRTQHHLRDFVLHHGEHFWGEHHRSWQWGSRYDPGSYYHHHVFWNSIVLNHDQLGERLADSAWWPLPDVACHRHHHDWQLGHRRLQQLLPRECDGGAWTRYTCDFRIRNSGLCGSTAAKDGAVATRTHSSHGLVKPPTSS